MKNQEKPQIPKTRLIIASVILLLSFILPVFIPLILLLPLSEGWKSTISGLFVFGIPQLLTLLTIVLVGKEGFRYIKQKAFGLLKKAAPPDVVSLTRYTIGLVMFTIPLLMAWVLPYISTYLNFYEVYKLHINLGGDLLLIVSLFVLGGDFWDKLRSLFLYRSRAIHMDDQQ